MEALIRGGWIGALSRGGWMDALSRGECRVKLGWLDGCVK